MRGPKLLICKRVFRGKRGRERKPKLFRNLPDVFYPGFLGKSKKRNGFSQPNTEREPKIGESSLGYWLTAGTWRNGPPIVLLRVGCSRPNGIFRLVFQLLAHFQQKSNHHFDVGTDYQDALGDTPAPSYYCHPLRRP